MPAFPSDQEIRQVGACLAELALERAAEAAVEYLRAVAHDHFPEHDPYDLTQVVPRLRQELRDHAQLVYQRRVRLEASGVMRRPGAPRTEGATPGGPGEPA